MTGKGVRISLRRSVLLCILLQYFIALVTCSNSVLAEDTNTTRVEHTQALKTNANGIQTSESEKNEDALSDTETAPDALSGIKEDPAKPAVSTNEQSSLGNISVEVKNAENSSENTSVTTLPPVNNEDINENKTSEKTPEQDFLPEEGAAEKEHSSSLAIFFVLFVTVLCIFLIHTILQYNCHYIPESLAIVFLGALVGLIMKILPTADIKKIESFSPTMFFLVLLPPIIFESGYNLHKGRN